MKDDREVCDLWRSGSFSSVYQYLCSQTRIRLNSNLDIALHRWKQFVSCLFHLGHVTLQPDENYHSAVLWPLMQVLLLYQQSCRLVVLQARRN